MKILELPIILVSKSPRRRQLLEQAGFQFVVKPQDVPEDYPEDMAVEDVASFLAQKKVRASRAALGADGILLGADSVVILDGVIYEKPTSRENAQQILRQLSGREHTVITGVCLASAEKERVFSGVSRVQFDKISDEEIDYYIDRYEPYDKAGAYAIQEWIGLCKINRIEGTYANVMGLPVDLVYQELRHFV